MLTIFHLSTRRGRAWRCGVGRLLLAGLALLQNTTAFADLAPLSLTDAIRLAEQQAPEIRARNAGIGAAAATVEPAGQLPDPELLFGIDNLPLDGDAAFSTTRDFMTMRRVGLMQQFPRREKRRLRSERAASEVERERALLSNEQLVLREDVARAWIGVRSAEQRLALLRALQPNAQAQFAAATAALTAGRGSAADGIAARAAMAALDDRIDAAQAEREMARAELQRWLPDLGETPLAEPPDWSDPAAYRAAQDGDLAHHRELLAYAATARTATLDVALARAEKRPDWSLELAYAQRAAPFSDMLSLQLRVPLVLFARHRQDPLIASRQAQLERIEAERETAQRMHGAALRKTVTLWRSTAERMHRYEQELLPLADDRAAAALAAYRSGRGDLQACLAALDAAIAQRLAYADLQNTLGQAWAALHFAFAGEG